MADEGSPQRDSDTDDESSPSDLEGGAADGSADAEDSAVAGSSPSDVDDATPQDRALENADEASASVDEEPVDPAAELHGADDTPDEAHGADAKPNASAKTDVRARETTKGRTWLRRIGILLAVVAALVGTSVLLVRWSIREHKRLLFEGADSSRLDKTMLFPQRTHGYDQYRAPALIVTPAGDLLAFAEARQSDDDWKGIDLVTRRSSDDGKTWSEVEVMITEPGAAVGTPTPVVDREQKSIWLVYRTSRIVRRRHQIKMFVVHSTDDGHSWSKPVDLLRHAKFPRGLSRRTIISPGPGHGIQLRNGPWAGRLLIPTHAGHDTRASLRRREKGRAQALISDDHGKTWRFGEGTDYGSENTLGEWTNGNVFMFIRGRAYPEERKMKRYAVSKDGGASWEPTGFSDRLVMPVCHSTLLFHPDGGPEGKPAFFFLQPDVKATGRWDKGARRKLTLFLSTDGTKTWPLHRVVHEGGASYSDMAIGREGQLQVLFEVGLPDRRDKLWGGQVMYTPIPIAWLDDSLGKRADVPFSENVYELYRSVRGPFEDWWKD